MIGAMMAPEMVSAAERLSGRWRDGAEVELAAEMTELTLAIVGRTLFDADVERDARDVGEALTVAMEAFDRFMVPGAALLERLPLPSTRRFQAARRRLDTIIERMIDGPFLLPHGFSILDIYAAMFTRWSLEPDWKLANLPKLMALAENVAKRPAIAPVWARHFPEAK